MIDNKLKELEQLYAKASKHSSYQEIHPAIAKKTKYLSEIGCSKQEKLRQDYLNKNLDYKNALVLEIGSNTGYFSISSLQNGARHITCYEGNREHLNFLKTSLNILDISTKATLFNEYYGLENTQNTSDQFDICIFLNVLHHLGDDFGENQDSSNGAKITMAKYLNGMAKVCKKMAFQMGFNWKGNPNLPLFNDGTKAEMIHFIEEATHGYWDIEEIGAPSHDIREYMPINKTNNNNQRINSIGEFLNRPIFILKSRLI